MDGYDLHNLDVLILDENDFMLDIVASVLKGLGITRIRETLDPDIAFDMFKSQPADLIFSDWIPGHDDMRFVMNVRTDKNSPNPFVPIIVISSYSEKPYVLAARDLGMTEFLAMPVSAESIYKRICAVIQDERRFIKSESYHGPDRRRHKNIEYTGTERRASPPVDEAEDTHDAQEPEESPHPKFPPPQSPPPKSNDAD